ncbi:MAG TPA: YccF domain-containing protein [Anaerolineales bacterium]
MTYVRTDDRQFPFVLRVLWFFLLGWHVTLYWILIAWLLNVTIIGLPLGAWMINRVPMVLTLRMPRTYTVGQMGPSGTVFWQTRGTAQPNLLVRIIYFVLIGWWFSLVWSILAWLLCVTIIGLPFGVWMFNRLPNVTTLMNQ